ncbi:MAG TPA: DUF1015 family protein [Ignavibacteriales bacterium]|nr:DUF1015 family protein [Ignavibacteriales bacterium]HOL80133.1 DUF1015 family protein [Ignavibacteriales bacterium]HOM65072.1 DUF1015 family protein [Ignavibacteriales bacterium]HPD67901.1 DUF1015 family protein [Ignavibacteriales bacterium]HPP32322.1 DUF1015 family protein [Ignavibacteriales bacterium]
MAIIRPFKALRPKKEFAHLVASVPYDVVNTEEAKELVKGNEYSLLRVTRSEVELPDNIDHYSAEVYEHAKANLEKLINNGILFNDEKPFFYFYRQIMNGRAQTGIAATYSVEDYKNNVIMKHEKTRKDKEDDRTRHIITTKAQTGPVFLTYRGSEKVREIIKKVTENQKPEYDFTAADSIQHTMWVCPEEYNQIIIDEIAKVDKLYIADGHHRAASAFRTCEEMKKNNPNHSGNEEYNYFLAVLFSADELKILPYNRVVVDLNGYTDVQFMEKVKENFDIQQIEYQEPKNPKEFCMYLNGKWYLLKPNTNVKKAASVGDNLDVSILQNYLLHPILGIDDPRTSKRIDFIGGIRGTQELVKLVDSGKFKVAFLLYPVTLDDLMAISDAGEIMPPKSTWFEPKLRDGIVIHTI